MKKILILFFIAWANVSAGAQERVYQWRFEAEAGYLGFLHHTYQSGDPGTNFNYISRGGQDILFPLTRFNAELTLGEAHTIALLYQPLEVNTTVLFQEDVLIDSKTFDTGEVVDIRYSFPFWRLTYLYDFAQEENLQLEAGLALQLRNLAFSFEEVSGGGFDYANSQNLGPVPALAFRAAYGFDGGLWLIGELTGIYASSALVNGASFDFEGSILDVSLQAALEVDEGVQTYVKLRFLGGTSAGSSEFIDRTWSESSANFTSNYLATWAPTVGFRLTL
jgi:hypothetical protein